MDVEEANDARSEARSVGKCLVWINEGEIA